MRKKTTEEFLQQLVDKNIKYVLLSDEYLGNKVKLVFECPEKHIFECSPNNILRDRGCPICRLQTMSKLHSKSLEQYIREIRIQGYEDEVLGIYVNQNLKLLHKCVNGHEHEAYPLNMIRGLGGCPHCDKRGIPHKLYYIKIGIYYKIGITRRTVKIRFTLDKDKPIKILNLVEYPDFPSAKIAEKAILKQYEKFKVTDNPKYLTSGNTELFNIDILGLDNV
jgi:hypothetical protein